MDNFFGIHATALKIRGSRAELLAANIANADTPNYKARDLDFSQALGKVSYDAGMKRTHTAHLDAANMTVHGAEIQYRNPTQPSLDGNTVDLHTERTAFMENAMMYQASLRFLNGSINTLKTAIRGEI